MREDGQTLDLKMLASLENSHFLDNNGVMGLGIITDKNLVSSAVVWDGQTVVMTKRLGDQQFAIFVTTTLIDRAGNRVSVGVEKAAFIESRQVHK